MKVVPLMAALSWNMAWLYIIGHTTFNFKNTQNEVLVQYIRLISTDYVKLSITQQNVANKILASGKTRKNSLICPQDFHLLKFCCFPVLKLLVGPSQNEWIQMKKSQVSSILFLTLNHDNHIKHSNIFYT